jgi:hypothetical protein
VLIALRILVDVLQGLGDSPVAPPSVGRSGPSTAAACPAQVARWLPSSGAGSTLISAYQTSKFLITLCQAPGGQLYYDGQVKNQPPSEESHISLPATATSSGYLARNGAFAYEIKNGIVIVSHQGKVMTEERLQPAS